MENIQKNARLKILKQLKFSHQNGLKFERPDAALFNTQSFQNQRDLPELLKNDRFANKLEAIENMSAAVPDDTFRDHDSQTKTVNSTARHQELFGSTKYGTNLSVTEQDSQQLPEGIQQLKIPNTFYTSFQNSRQFRELSTQT